MNANPPPTAVTVWPTKCSVYSSYTTTTPTPCGAISSTLYIINNIDSYPMVLVIRLAADKKDYWGR